MSKKEEIEKLMKACEECVGKSSDSYEEHFSDCPTCKKYATEAEKLNKQLEFLEDLATKPLETRKQLLGARIRSFLSMPDDKRKEAISDLLDALEDISEDASVKVVKARTDIIMEIPKEHRETLLGVLGDIMSDWPAERKMKEKQAVMKATEDYFFLKRKMARKKFSTLLK